MKKVLIIAFYWPPSGSSSVQRAVKFVKYLPKFNWQPVILTVEKGTFNAFDHSLEKEIPAEVPIYRSKIFEPHNFYQKFTEGKVKEAIPLDAMAEESSSWKKRLAFWLRLNVFVPDSRIGWLPYAIKAGKEIIEKEKIDIIFSTSPPPTVHLIAKKLARWSGLKWVADFRDPWTNIHYLKNSARLAIAQKIDEKLERNVLNAADAIVAVSQYDIQNDYSRKVREKNKIYYIPNGYDESDYREHIDPDFRLEDERKFKMGHIGTLTDDRIPEKFFQVLSVLKNEKRIDEENFCLYLIGQVSDSAIQLLNELDIFDLVKIVPYLPHREIFNYYNSMDALLLLTYRSPANIPGKTFEYMRAGKPILVIGNKNGEAAKVLRNTSLSRIAEYDDSKEIYRKFLEIFNSTRKEEPPDRNRETIEWFERRNLTGKLAEIFNKLSS